MTHTPGPWRLIDGWNLGVATLAEDGPIARHICTMAANKLMPPSDKRQRRPQFGPDQQDEANARLIAAAPDLLAACKDMLSYIEDYAASADEDDPAHELLPRYRAAIAKAEGKGE